MMVKDSSNLLKVNLNLWQITSFVIYGLRVSQAIRFSNFSYKTFQCKVSTAIFLNYKNTEQRNN